MRTYFNGYAGVILKQLNQLIKRFGRFGSERCPAKIKEYVVNHDRLGDG